MDTSFKKQKAKKEEGKKTRRVRLNEVQFTNHDSRKHGFKLQEAKKNNNPPITYYWTRLIILDHSYFVGNLTNSKMAETKALEPLKS
jgi:hypothetical protein